MSINLDLTFQGGAPVVSVDEELNLQYAAFPENGYDFTTYAPPAEPNTGFCGSVLAGNKKLYFIPRVGDYVLVFDTVSKQTSRINGIPSAFGTNLYIGGVLAKNGKIYCIPHANPMVLIIDPDTDTVDVTKMTGLGGAGKWNGGCLAPNGKIYCMPSASNSVAIIDPETDTIDTSTITGVASIYGTGSLAENGKIYCPPLQGTTVLIIDPETDTVDYIPGIHNANFSSSCLAKNGKIYCAPMASTYILIIDPYTDTRDITTISGIAGFNKWNGSCTALNGKVYLGANNSDDTGIIDVETDTLTTLPFPVSGASKVRGCGLDEFGVCYFSPYTALKEIYTIKTGVPTIPLRWAISAYRNKY